MSSARGRCGRGPGELGSARRGAGPRGCRGARVALCREGPETPSGRRGWGGGWWVATRERHAGGESWRREARASRGGRGAPGEPGPRVMPSWRGGRVGGSGGAACARAGCEMPCGPGGRESGAVEAREEMRVAGAPGVRRRAQQAAPRVGGRVRAGAGEGVPRGAGARRVGGRPRGGADSYGAAPRPAGAGAAGRWGGAGWSRRATGGGAVLRGLGRGAPARGWVGGAGGGSGGRAHPEGGRARAVSVARGFGPAPGGEWRAVGPARQGWSAGGGSGGDDPRGGCGGIASRRSREGARAVSIARGAARPRQGGRYV